MFQIEAYTYGFEYKLIFGAKSGLSWIFSPWNWKNQVFYGQKFLKLDTLKLL